MSEENDHDLEMTEKLFSFLQGKDKHGCTIRRKLMPHLTEDQAWTVIWWLGNEYWKVTDRVEKCDVCGTLFHTWQSGDCLDYGKAPYHFCDNCIHSEEYVKKMRRNPDKQARKDYFEK